MSKPHGAWFSDALGIQINSRAFQNRYKRRQAASKAAKRARRKNRK